MVQLQILTNVLQERRAAVLMLCATIPKDLMAVNVNLDFQWMDGPAKVTQCNIAGLNSVPDRVFDYALSAQCL